MELQLNPLLVPLQEPERFSPARQVMLLHVWHVPGLAPSRYWLVVQTMFRMVVMDSVDGGAVGSGTLQSFDPLGHVFAA